MRTPYVKILLDKTRNKPNDMNIPGGSCDPMLINSSRVGSSFAR